MIEKLKQTFNDYEGSHYFIDCVEFAFKKCGASDKAIRWFVNNHFKTDEKCDFGSMKRLATHWNNVAFDKLNQHDFLNYKHCLNTVGYYRIVCKTMEEYEQD